MLINLFRARGYNKPEHFKMFASQWMHQLFMWNIISYEKYQQIQNWLYRNE